MSRHRNPQAAARETLFKLGAFLAILPFVFAQLVRPAPGILQDWAPVFRPLVILIGLLGLAGFLYLAFRIWKIRETEPATRAEKLVSRMQVKTWNPRAAERHLLPEPAHCMCTETGPPNPPSAAAEIPLLDRLKAIDWYQFEKLVAAVFEGRGYRVMRQSRDEPSVIVALIAERHGRKCVVRCCPWNEWPVRPDTIRDLARSRADLDASEAIVVAATGSTPAARELAMQNRVELVDGDLLQHWIHELRFTRSWPSIQKALDARDKWCPRCHAPLVERLSRQGPTAGRSFWGCSRFPECRFTLEA